MAPTIRSLPHPGFSFAIRTTNRSVSSSTLGRPRDLRNFDPSNLLAMSFRYQASSVSGFATAANSSKAFRPSRWAISDNVAFSASDNNNPAFDLDSQDPVLCNQIFVPQKKFLVYGSGHVSKHASPSHSRVSLNLIQLCEEITIPETKPFQCI
jgi:hypothetical protein